MTVESPHRSATLRPAAPGDREFLVEVYASTRSEELARTGWSRPEIDAFVGMQYEFQDRHYAAAFPEAERSIVMVGDRPVGRLYVHRDKTEIRVVDVALLPDFRGRGIGNGLVTDLVAEGARTGRPVRIHVERDNRARSLYERLGFVEVADDGVYRSMERPV